MTWSIEAMTWAAALTLVLLGCRAARVLYYLLIIGLALAALPLAPPALRRQSLWHRYARRAPSIAILAPAFNEERTVITSVTSLLRQDYPHLEVIVINDGSRDATLGLLVAHFGLVPIERNYNLWVEHAPIRGLYGSSTEPRLVVIDKVNGGNKADAINAGINVARAALTCVIDTDSLIEPDALQRLAAPFIEDPHATIAAGGAIRVINGCTVEAGRIVEAGLPRGLLARFQALEYLRAFLLARVALSRLGLLTIVSGAFGLFDRRVLLEIGGYGRDTCGEDFELIVRMHRHMREQGARYRVAYLPDPVCWTQVPDDLAALASQRRRWQRGAIETFARHRAMALRPAYGRVGLVALPWVFVMDVAGPLLALLSYLAVPLLWAVGLLETLHFLAFVGTALSFSVFVSTSTLILEELEFRQFRSARELATIGLIAVAENLGYRQLNTLWRLRGLVDYWRGSGGWDAIPRKALGEIS